MSNPDAIQRYFVVNGSYLRHDGKVVLNSLSKVNMIAEVSDSNTSFEIDGQPVINMNFYVKKTPNDITVNGREVKAKYNVQKHLIRIKVTN